MNKKKSKIKLLATSVGVLGILLGFQTFAAGQINSKLTSRPPALTKPASSLRKSASGHNATPITTHDARPPRADDGKTWEFKKHGGVVYAKWDNEELKCDVYQPQGDGRFPAVLMIHGGAWRSGSKLHYIRHAWALASRGFVAVVINYRHAPSAKFPAQIHDCKNAIRWIRANADKYQIDAQKIGAFGYSAGGHLASLLATTQPQDRLEGKPVAGLEGYSTAVDAVAIGGTPCEFSWIDENSILLVYFLGATRAEAPQRYRRASPIHFVDPSDRIPFRVFHGDRDFWVPVESSKKLKKRLEECGISCEWESVNAGHLGTISDFECFERTIQFFERTLRNTATDSSKKAASQVEPLKRK